MTTTPKPNDIETMLVAVQAALSKLGNVGRDGKGHHGAYATLEHVLAVAKPVLAEHDLAIVQHAVNDDAGRVGCRTYFVHPTGVFDCGTLLLEAGKGPQAAGATLTYARRFALMAALGVAAADDDDGVAAQTAYDQRPTEPAAATGPQIRKLQTLFTKLDIEERGKRLAYCVRVVGRDLESSKDLTRSEAATVIDQLEQDLT